LNQLRILQSNFQTTSPKSQPKTGREMLWGVRRERVILGAGHQPMERPMSKPNDLSRSLIAFEQNNTLIAVIEMSLSSWLVAGNYKTATAQAVSSPPRRPIRHQPDPRNYPASRPEAGRGLRPLIDHPSGEGERAS
jgi:hypothetical protein